MVGFYINTDDGNADNDNHSNNDGDNNHVNARLFQ